MYKEGFAWPLYFSDDRRWPQVYCNKRNFSHHLIEIVDIVKENKQLTHAADIIKYKHVQSCRRSASYCPRYTIEPAEEDSLYDLYDALKTIGKLFGVRCLLCDSWAHAPCGFTSWNEWDMPTNYSIQRFLDEGDTLNFDLAILLPPLCSQCWAHMPRKSQLEDIEIAQGMINILRDAGQSASRL